MAPKDSPSRLAPRRRRYEHPPIIERILEVHVVPGPTTIEVAVEALARRWPEFPSVEEGLLGGIQLTFDMKTLSTSHETQARLRFWSPDRKRLLQAGREIFVVNDLLPEPGWDEMGPLFKRAYPDFLDIMQPRETVRAVMRYRNRVVVPPSSTVARMFTIFPRLPEERTTANAPFQMIVDMGDRRAGPSTVALAHVGGVPQTTYALDLIVESGRKALKDAGAVFAWAEEAHVRVTELFDESITDEARDTFGERTDR